LRINPTGNPKEDREADFKRRRDAQARRPLIAQWAPDIPTGYIHVDDAIEYMTRRWGKMLRAEMLETFSRDDTGPMYTIFGDFPDKSRGQRYYAFDAIDMWVYRTMTGVPAAWRDIRRLPKGQQSTVPIRRIQLSDIGDRDGEEQGDGGTRFEKDGRRRH
jgi:hypothetical protein